MIYCVTVPLDASVDITVGVQFTDALSTAYSMLLATNGLLPYSLSTTELGERADVEERAAGVADLMLHGLLRR